MGTVGFLRKETQNFVFDGKTLQGNADIVKRELHSLMDCLVDALVGGVVNRCLGPNGETKLDWEWPINVEVGIECLGTSFRYVAEVSAEGRWR